MKRSFLLLSLFLQLAAHAQYKIKAPIGLYNRDSVHIIGIGVGLAAFSMQESRTYGLHIEVFGWGEMLAHDRDADTGNDKDDSTRIADIKDDWAPTGKYGITISGLGSICRDCEAAGISINGITGFQLRQYGISIAGLANGADLLYGMQVSIMANGASVGTGAQISMFNMSDLLFKGVQVGGFNRANTFHGLQIGFVNRATTLKGLQLGLWNMNGKRKMPIINW
jgi:hypothetical protein